MSLWLALAAMAADSDMVATSEVVRSGTTRERVAQDDADVVIFYTGEHRGKLGTCGCDENPRGGLARLGGYLDAVRRHGPGTPSALVHTGWWASDRIGDTVALTDQAQRDNDRMVEALGLLGVSAVNLTFRDGLYLREAPVPEVAVSANAAEGLTRYRRLEAGSRSIVVTGVGRLGAGDLQPPGWAWTDPVAAVRSVIAEVSPDDLLVVLAFETGRATAAIAAIEGVDVVIEAGGFAGKLDPEVRGGSVWVQSRDDGLAVGELRLWLDGEGRVERVVDRWVDLDAMIPDQPELWRLERDAEREARRERRLARREASS